MGTRINILFSHSLDDWRDRDTSLALLNGALPAAIALDSYWSGAGKEHTLRASEWIAGPEFPPQFQGDYYRYKGPGPLFVQVNPLAVRVRTGGRWRGFLSIQALRDAHLVAFEAIAAAFLAREYFCFADNDFVDDVFLEGGGVPGCLDVLNRKFGPPGALIRETDHAVALETEHGVPQVWYRGTVA